MEIPPLVAARKQGNVSSELVHWNTGKNMRKNISEFIKKYEPKVIREYEEDGIKIKVYEGR